ncbi:CLUMA_CG003324, isoform A [Clunio marinus]|uniref:CLUMA_CG003324, isoform A n=1 Tax=Clunio marinus TaxID=568069 RepID=A0A1J1HT02_9DIPT|nr:CLUMA_CG003324, isoform A [Clunio marinus]
MEGHVDSNLRNFEINDVKILSSKFVKRIIKRYSNQKTNIHICGESCNEKPKNSYLKKEDNQKSLKTSKEKSVNAKERGIKPFIPHPLSLGFNYRQVRTAFYYNNEKKEMEKRNALKPLSSFNLPKKPFFPNFIDPVPENIPSTFGICQNETQSKILLSSDPSVTSNSHQSHEVKDNKTKKNEAENINVSNNKEELSLNILLLLFFRNTCPDMLLSNRKCNDEKCLD